MASALQIEANRQNARKSTGPRTVEGKAKVAGNALRHGLTGKRVVLPGEDPEEFDAFRADMIENLDPHGVLELFLVDKIVADAWRVNRILLIESTLRGRDLHAQTLKAAESARAKYLKRELSIFEKILEPNLGSAPPPTVDPADQQAFDEASRKLDQLRAADEEPSFQLIRVLEQHELILAKFQRYEADLFRSLFKTLHELQRLQAMRNGARLALLDVNVDAGHENVSGDLK